MSERSSQVSEEEKIWGLIAWLLSIVGAVLVLTIKPNLRYAKYWSYLSISFFIVAIISGAICGIISLIPFIGSIFTIFIGIALLVLWIIGMVKSLEYEYWKPPLVYNIALAIGIERI